MFPYFASGVERTWAALLKCGRPEVFCKKGVLRNFTQFTRKHVCQSLFLNKGADLRSATLLKKKLWHRCFPGNFGKFLRTPFFKEHLQWLLPLLDSYATWVIRKPMAFGVLQGRWGWLVLACAWWWWNLETMSHLREALKRIRYWDIFNRNWYIFNQEVEG